MYIILYKLHNPYRFNDINIHTHHMSYTEINCIKIYIECNRVKHTHHVSMSATNSCATD